MRRKAVSAAWGGGSRCSTGARQVSADDTSQAARALGRRAERGSAKGALAVGVRSPGVQPAPRRSRRAAASGAEARALAPPCSSLCRLPLPHRPAGRGGPRKAAGSPLPGPAPPASQKGPLLRSRPLTLPLLLQEGRLAPGQPLPCAVGRRWLLFQRQALASSPLKSRDQPFIPPHPSCLMEQPSYGKAHAKKPLTHFRK